MTCSKRVVGEEPWINAPLPNLRHNASGQMDERDVQQVIEHRHSPEHFDYSCERPLPIFSESQTNEHCSKGHQ